MENPFRLIRACLWVKPPKDTNSEKNDEEKACKKNKKKIKIIFSKDIRNTNKI